MRAARLRAALRLRLRRLGLRLGLGGGGDGVGAVGGRDVGAALGVDGGRVGRAALGDAHRWWSSAGVAGSVLGVYGKEQKKMWGGIGEKGDEIGRLLIVPRGGLGLRHPRGPDPRALRPAQPTEA